MPRAAIYARISSDRDGDQLGVRRQLKDCEALAARKGWDVAERYVDDDVSAYSGRVRPEYRRMLDDLAAGVVDAVVVWDLDRLHRRPKELEEFFELCEAAGIRSLASVAGDVDLATHDGQFTARILGAVARKESDDKSRRIKRKALELAQAGRDAGGGSRPYGYEPDRKTVRAEEAEIIRECARRFLAGESLRSLCVDLDGRGIKTVKGGAWNPTILRNILHSGRISGQREHHGELVAKGEWPAIISSAETDRIRAILSDPSRRTNHSARRYLLKRLLRCGLCGETLVSRPTQDGTRRYICAKGPQYSGCGHLYIVAEPLEELVVAGVLYRLDSPELAAALHGSSRDAEAEEWQQEADSAARQSEELAQAYGTQEITLAEWLAARRPIEHRLTAARRKLAHISGNAVIGEHVGQGADLRERWSQLNLTRQHAIVAAVVDHLVIGPGQRGLNRFDPTRVTPVWRA